jgi:uncharacterized protein
MAEQTTTEGGIPGFEVLIDTDSLPGAFQQDGSIVFDDLDFQPTVSANTKIAKFSPPDDCKVEPTAGSNVTTDVEDDAIVFYAATEGVCRIINNQVTVFEILNIEDDVGFETGNLQFDGSIYIKGKVGQAFQVKSGGDVIVTGGVEAGAKVSAMGNVCVGSNIVGIRTKVIAMESIRAGRINDAYVFSGKNIHLGSSSENGTLRSGGRISVNHVEEDARGGSISGGQAWALQGLDLHTAGTPTGTNTQLNAGLDLEHGKKLDELTGKIETGNQQIQRLLDRFNMTSLDVGQIQKRLAAAQGPKKKILANSAHQLGQIVKSHQALLQERAKITGSLGKTLPNAHVTVREKAYAGVAIRIGDQITRVRNDIEHSVFLIRNDALVYAPIDDGQQVPASDEPPL